MKGASLFPVLLDVEAFDSAFKTTLSGCSLGSKDMDKSAKTILAKYIDGHITRTTEINLWTIQQPGAVEELFKTGSLQGNPAFSFNASFDKPGKKSAYQWMTKQMQIRGLGISNEAVPLWAFLLPPAIDEFWESRPGDRMIQFKVPLNRALLSIHGAWCKFLHFADNPGSQFLGLNDEDGTIQQSRNHAIRDPQTCLKSWERMFELALINSPGFSLPATIQATLTLICAKDVVDVTG